LIDPGDHSQTVVTTEKPAAKELRVSRRPENLIVQFGDQRNLVGTDNVDLRVGHGNSFAQ
jgi:hypothetical protein